MTHWNFPGAKIRYPDVSDTMVWWLIDGSKNIVISNCSADVGDWYINCCKREGNQSAMDAKMRARSHAVAWENADKLTDDWMRDPYWVSWATKFDNSDLVYFLPEVYETLTLLTGKSFDFVPVWYGDILLYLVGFYDGEQPFGPFWHNSFNDKLKCLDARMVRLCAFAETLQRDLNESDSDRLYLWSKSFRESRDYFIMHRLIVRRVGRLLDVDMDDHDLTKSRIVQIALGFLWHWPGENERSSQMKKLALDSVHAGHLEVEDHHPEHETTGMGSVDVHKLFVDRLSVHLQKDVPDKRGGWNIDPKFIPSQYQDEWASFLMGHFKIDLYQVLVDVTTT